MISLVYCVQALNYQEQCNGLPFQAFLIQPIQRIPRYQMLLTDLVRHTPQEHPDYQNLNKALAKVWQLSPQIRTSMLTKRCFVCWTIDL
jgi:hypothetical protein